MKTIPTEPLGRRGEGRRLAVEDPDVFARAAECRPALEAGESSGHCWPRRADELRERLVCYWKFNPDAVGPNPPPALREVPEQQRQPVVGPARLSDR